MEARGFARSVQHNPRKNRTSVNPIIISKESAVPAIVVVTMRNDGNAKKTWKGRGGGKEHNKAQGKGKVRSTPKQDGPKEKICLFVPFTTQNANIHHAHAHAKEHFTRTVNLRLGDHANDVRDALIKGVAFAPAEPVRGRAADITETMPVRPTQMTDETSAAFEGREATCQTNLTVCLQAKAEHEFEQSSSDMKHKSALNEHDK